MFNSYFVNTSYNRESMSLNISFLTSTKHKILKYLVMFSSPSAALL
jgi:hypothetical protein